MWCCFASDLRARLTGTRHAILFIRQAIFRVLIMKRFSGYLLALSLGLFSVHGFAESEKSGFGFGMGSGTPTRHGNNYGWGFGSVDPDPDSEVEQSSASGGMNWGDDRRRYRDRWYGNRSRSGFSFGSSSRRYPYAPPPWAGYPPAGYGGYPAPMAPAYPPAYPPPYPPQQAPDQQ